MTKPLNRLTANYRPPKKRGKIYKHEPSQSVHSPSTPLAKQWPPECETAFHAIISKLTSAPILAFANPQLPYILHTDACRDRLGAGLHQEQEGKVRAIAYASRGLSKSEQNYPTHKLEFLALKWAVCEKFSHYLYGSSFSVLTDNNPLTYVLTSAKLDAAGHRWLAALSTYHFTIKYRAGQANKDADRLSQQPQEPPHKKLQKLEKVLTTPYTGICFSLAVSYLSRIKVNQTLKGKGTKSGQGAKQTRLKEPTLGRKESIVMKK